MKPESMLYNALTVIGAGGCKRGEPGRYARQVLRKYEATVNPPTVRPLRCNICRQMLPPDSFSVDQDKPTGRRPECRECMKVRRDARAQGVKRVVPKLKPTGVTVEEARARMARMEAGLPMDGIDSGTPTMVTSLS